MRSAVAARCSSSLSPQSSDSSSSASTFAISSADDASSHGNGSSDLPVASSASITSVYAGLTVLGSESPTIEKLDPFALVADELANLGHKLWSMVAVEVPRLAEAAEYFFKLGVEGKRFRPMVASLLHDDVLDHADTRRGIGSLNQVTGNKLAVLAGDFLLSRASVALASLHNTEVVELLSKVLEHLVTGEIMQLTTETREMCSWR